MLFVSGHTLKPVIDSSTALALGYGRFLALGLPARPLGQDDCAPCLAYNCVRYRTHHLYTHAHAKSC